MGYEIKQSNEYVQRLVQLCEPSTPTLLFLSGGSALPLFVEFSKKITTPLHHITIGFVDERFDFQHSNYVQLLQKFPAAIAQTTELGATWIDTRPQQKDQYEMAKWYEEEIRKKQKEKRKIICLLGMGKDGHIAGIFPDEEKKFTERFVDTHNLVIGYEANNEYSKRFTATFPLLKKADHILVYITGEEKKATLTHALHDTPPLHECPAAFLANTSQTSEIYTDIAV